MADLVLVPYLGYNPNLSGPTYPCSDLDLSIHVLHSDLCLCPNRLPQSNLTWAYPPVESEDLPGDNYL